jgi:hypothetical protein
MSNILPGEEDGITDVTPIPNAPSDGSVKLNELLSVLSLLAFLWGLFK